MALGLLAAMTVPALAQSSLGALDESELSARKIFFMLFLMLGPIKILVPFVDLTRDCDPGFRRTMARRAIIFSAAALVIAGVLGRTMLDNFDISLPVLALTGGVILFLVALQTVLQQPGSVAPLLGEVGGSPNLKMALAPLAFPIIVTPYGVAAVIVFGTLAGNELDAGSMVIAIVLLILVLDWVAMLFAEAILKWVGTTLQVFAVVLGVTQVALGLQIILHNLHLVGVFVEREQSTELP